MRKIIPFMIIAFLFIGSSSAEVLPNTFTLSSQSFENQSVLGKMYTCDGRDIPPQLSWFGIPSTAKSLVLIFSDPDAPGGTFYHWILYNIPTSLTHLDDHVKKLPPEVLVGKNSWGKMEYNGPCPPKGATHAYLFTLYALDSKLTLPAGADAKTVLEALQPHIVAKAEINTSYGRSSR